MIDIKNENQSVRFWKIAPGERGFLWNEQRDKECIALGWNKTGDLRKFKNDEDITKSFKKIIEYRGSSSSQLLKFYHEVKEGDKILACAKNLIFGIGVVKGDYNFDDTLYYKHSRPVHWEIVFWESLSFETSGLSEKLQRKLNPPRGITVKELKYESWLEIEKNIIRKHHNFKNIYDFEGLTHAPITEQEVVMLFSKLSRFLGMKIDSIGTKFPDAIVRIKRGNVWITKRVEIETVSSKFVDHGHDINGCDIIVCWKKNWAPPKSVKIIELRNEVLKII